MMIDESKKLQLISYELLGQMFEVILLFKYITRSRRNVFNEELGTYKLRYLNK